MSMQDAPLQAVQRLRGDERAEGFCRLRARSCRTAWPRRAAGSWRRSWTPSRAATCTWSARSSAAPSWRPPRTAATLWATRRATCRCRAAPAFNLSVPPSYPLITWPFAVQKPLDIHSAGSRRSCGASLIAKKKQPSMLRILALHTGCHGTFARRPYKRFVPCRCSWRPRRPSWAA